MKQCKRCSMVIENNVVECPRCGGTVFNQQAPVRPQGNVRPNMNQSMSQNPVRPNRNMGNTGDWNGNNDKIGHSPVTSQVNTSNIGSGNVDIFGNEVNFDPNFGVNTGRKKKGIPKKEKKVNPVESQQGFSTTMNSVPVITVKRWLGLWLLLCVPILNIVIIIKTLTDKNENKSIKNYIKAYLIMTIIGLIFGILSSLVLSNVIINSLM